MKLNECFYAAQVTITRMLMALFRANKTNCSLGLEKIILYKNHKVKYKVCNTIKFMQFIYYISHRIADSA
jgi:hypothetical protein